MIFRNLPALVTLLASLIVCVITFIYRYNLTKALVIMLGTAVAAFLVGLLIRALLNRFLVTEEPANADEEGNEAEAKEDAEENE